MMFIKCICGYCAYNHTKIQLEKHHYLVFVFSLQASVSASAASHLGIKHLFLFFYGVIRTVAQTPVADCERENLIGTKGGPVTITLSFFITENYDLKIIWKN